MITNYTSFNTFIKKVKEGLKRVESSKTVESKQTTQIIFTNKTRLFFIYDNIELFNELCSRCPKNKHIILFCCPKQSSTLIEIRNKGRMNGNLVQFIDYRRQNTVFGKQINYYISLINRQSTNNKPQSFTEHRRSTIKLG